MNKASAFWLDDKKRGALTTKIYSNDCRLRELGKATPFKCLYVYAYMFIAKLFIVDLSLTTYIV